MSRHRNVRTMNYEDEYYDEDEVYGHSYDDSYCVSPATAAQFTFNRERDINLSSYMEEGIPEEEDESDPEALSDSGRDNFKLDDVEQAKLNSCKEEIVNVIGDTIPEHLVSQAVVRNRYNIQATLNELLNQSEAPKPQRQPRPDRRTNRQDDDDDFDNFLESLEADSGEIIFSNQMKMSPHILKFGSSPIVENICRDRQISVAPDLLNSSDKPTDTVENKAQNRGVREQKTLHGKSCGEKELKDISPDDVKTDQKTSSQNIDLSAKAGVSLAQLASQKKGLSSAPLAQQKLSVTAPEQNSSPLAQLAAKHQGGTGNMEKKTSLAELAAKQDSSTKGLTKSPGVSLADLAAKEVKTRDTVDKKGPSLSQLIKISKEPSHANPAEKSRTTSLALLAQKHKETSDMKGGNLSATPLAHLALGKKKTAPSSVSSEQNQQGLSLAQLAAKQKMSSSNSGISLKQLAKQNEQKRAEKKTVSLGDLAKQIPVKPSESDNLGLKDEEHMSSLDQTQEINIKVSLRDLAKEKSANVPTKVSKEDLQKTEQLEVPDNQSIDNKENWELPKESKSTGNVSIEKLTLDFDALCNIIKRPSSIGKVMCGKFGTLRNNSRSNDYFFHKPFSFASQRKHSHGHSPEHKVPFKCFDFTTPSPDDVIKEKQKRAFSRPKERVDSK